MHIPKKYTHALALTLCISTAGIQAIGFWNTHTYASTTRRGNFAANQALQWISNHPWFTMFGAITGAIAAGYGIYKLYDTISWSRTVSKFHQISADECFSDYNAELCAYISCPVTTAPGYSAEQNLQSLCNGAKTVSNKNLRALQYLIKSCVSRDRYRNLLGKTVVQSIRTQMLRPDIQIVIPFEVLTQRAVEKYPHDPYFMLSFTEALGELKETLETLAVKLTREERTSPLLNPAYKPWYQYERTALGYDIQMLQNIIGTIKTSPLYGNQAEERRKQQNFELQLAAQHRQARALEDQARVAEDQARATQRLARAQEEQAAQGQRSFVDRIFHR